MRGLEVFNELISFDHSDGDVAMNSEYPLKAPHIKAPPSKTDERIAPSRFIDEKISDESGTETKSDSALAPAGLKNPFWN